MLQTSFLHPNLTLPKIHRWFHPSVLGPESQEGSADEIGESFYLQGLRRRLLEYL